MPAIPFPYHYCRSDVQSSLHLLLCALLLADIACRLMIMVRPKKSSSSNPTCPEMQLQAPQQVMHDYCRRDSVPRSAHLSTSPGAISKSKSHDTALTLKPTHDARFLISRLVSRTAYLESKLSRLAFAHFADRTILTNKIWQQNSDIINLHRALYSTRTFMVHSFCDKVALENEAWTQKAEAKRLGTELEKAKRGKVKSIVSMAKTLAVNSRKVKRMEEDIQARLDLTVETRLSRVEEEGADSLALRREVERYQLAEEARAVQQELSNQVEEDLRAELLRAKKDSTTLKEQVVGYEKLIDGLWADLQKPKLH